MVKLSLVISVYILFPWFDLTFEKKNLLIRPPFVKQFALCYRTVVLSVTLVYIK